MLAGGMRSMNKRQRSPLPMSRTDKGYRGDASQFFVAGELCRRELVAVVTLGNCPNTDILVSNSSGTHFAHVQVKTFVPGNRTVSVGRKSERDFGSNFFWVLAGIPTPEFETLFEYFIIPSADMAKNMKETYEIWARTPGLKGQRHNVETNKVRAIRLPPRVETNGWSLEPYRNRWDLIIEAVST
jgi:hypothetical protein